MDPSTIINVLGMGALGYLVKRVLNSVDELRALIGRVEKLEDDVDDHEKRIFHIERTYR